ncbi:ester cyclase [Umezawaea beigongshangensis]|uniref:ester cyclase n=1 Tax=Umezawaea beigongshangensis TaxID=2780383 RepID=UPI0018F184C8|nr:ester cyclase [Umezawaea beigongshangensis]
MVLRPGRTLLAITLTGALGAISACGGSVDPLAAGATSSRSGHDERGREGASATTGSSTDDDLRVDDPGLTERARALIRVGQDGIARENAAALDAFFHPDFRFHGPGGAELNREQLWAYFASARRAFDDFSVERQAIIDDGGPHLSSRTRFAGVFARTFDGTALGPLEPTGQPFSYDLINIFRYHEDGRLLEEWVQYDQLGQLAQLGVDVGDAAAAVS